jgi:hypothetical protein
VREEWDIGLRVRTPSVTSGYSTWVDYPLYQVLEDFQASLEEDPGTPDPDY